jgi:predicted RNA-binding protein YlqC (UPF0109 family)
VKVSIGKLFIEARKASDLLDSTSVGLQIDTVAQVYAKALDKVSTDYPNIKAQEAIVSAEAAIAKSIVDLRDSVSVSYRKGTIAVDKANILEACSNVKVSIDKLFIEARKASDLLDSTSVGLQIDTVAQVYAKVLDKVSTDYPNIKAQEAIVSAEAAIAKSIVDLRDSVSVSYRKGTIGVDKANILEACLNVKVSIGKLFIEARKASDLLDSTSVGLQIDTVAQVYAKALDKVSTDYPNIKAQEAIVSAEAAIAKSIVDLRDSVSVSYRKGTIAVDKEKMLAACDDAKAVVAKFLEDARKAFVKLKIQYGLVTSQIDVVEKSYNAAVEKINTEFTSIKDRDVIVNAESKIAKELLSMRDSAKTAYDKGDVEGKKAGIQDSCDVTNANIAALLKLAATVGISNVSAEDEVVVGIYTVSGVKVSTPVRGQVNIIKYKDGKVKSVYVK